MSSLTPREIAGRAGGWLLAPITGLVALVRHARMFHPDGLVYAAKVELDPKAPADLARVAERLCGDAMVRLSSAWWRGRTERPDVLGMAIRFLRDGEIADATARSDEQDLLLATVRFPWTTPFAPLTTKFSTFLWNHYHAVSPFEVEGVGRVKLRVRSPRIANDGGDVARDDHLAHAVAGHEATFELEARRLSLLPWKRTWEPIAKMTLEHSIVVDQARLRFSPFADGRGLHPVGFVHQLRVAAYAASQRARAVAV